MLQVFPVQTSYTEDLTWYVRSTVLGGQAIVELKADGTKAKGNVYANGALLAEHRPSTTCPGCPQNTQINEVNPLTGSGSKVDGNGSAYVEERDPQGAILGSEDP